MKHEQSPDAVERQIVAGLLDANVEALDQVLADGRRSRHTDRVSAGGIIDVHL
jgi:hypothetical protein